MQYHILRQILLRAPHGKHIAIEPIPELATFIRQRFCDDNVLVHELAMSDKPGTATFIRVLGEHGRSGLREQEYPRSDEKTSELSVRVDTVDNTLPNSFSVDFLKIDVEGAEYSVLCGAENTIKKYRPFTIFEHSPKMAATYGVTNDMLFDLIVEQYGMKLAFLPDWLNNEKTLDRQGFESHAGGNYVADPR
jgi:FkbM family methyltransferase